MSEGNAIPNIFSQNTIESQPETPIEAKPPVEEKVVQPEKKDFLSPKFAALTKKEREVRELQASLKQREAELAKRVQELDERDKVGVKGAADIEAEFKENPYKFLQKHGIKLEDLAKIALNDANPTPEMLINKTREELDSKYKKEIEDLKKSMEEKEQREREERYGQAKSAYMDQIGQHISGDESLEFVKAEGEEGRSLIYDIIEEFYNSEGKILPLADAARAAESYLEEQFKARYGNVKKFSQRAESQPPQEGKSPSSKQDKPASPTLSNNLASQVPTNGKRSTSREEDIEAAKSLLRWEE